MSENRFSTPPDNQGGSGSGSDKRVTGKFSKSRSKTLIINIIIAIFAIVAIKFMFFAS